MGGVRTGYAIEGGTAPGQVLATIPTGSPLPTFTFTAPSGVFYVRVRALVGGLPSEVSNEIRIAVNPPLAPAAPEGLTGLVNGSAIDLVWRHASDAGWPTGLLLDVSGSIATTLPLPPGERFSFPTVPNGTYTLAVRATNAFGSSAPSNAVTLTFPGGCSGVPAPPENLRVYKAGTRLFVYWQPASTGSATTSFVLSVGGAFTGAFATPERTLSGAVSPGVYVLSVAGVNACGQGPATAEQTVTVP